MAKMAMVGDNRGPGMILTILTLLCSLYLALGYQTVSEKPQYCSFFNNRAPSAQPGLKNCTWFKDNSCCMQQEIAATFGRVKPLKGASLSCQKYVNYLMCYICAPNQNIFYKRERLTVCESFCDALYDSCNSAHLKGSVIRNLYSSGREFCQSRRFEVATTGCFTFDVNLDTSASNQLKADTVLAMGLFMVSLVFLWPFGGLFTNAKPRTDFVSSREMGMFLRRWLTGHGARVNRHVDSRARDDRKDGIPKLSTHPRSIKLVAINCLYSLSHLCKKIMDLTWIKLSIFTFAIARSAVKLFYGIDHHHYQRRRGYHCRKLKTKGGRCFYVLTLLLCNIPLGVGSLSENDILNWADMLSKELSGIALNGLRYDEIQRLYDRAQYATAYVNGTAKILEVREKLGDYFVSKTHRAEVLGEKVRQIHDEWWMESTQVRGQAGAWGNRWRRAAQPTAQQQLQQQSTHNQQQEDTHSQQPQPQPSLDHQKPPEKEDGSSQHKLRFRPSKPAYTTAGKVAQTAQQRLERDTFLPNHGVDPVVSEIKMAPYVHINDLGLDVYKDADIPKRLPKNLFKYDRDYRREVMPDHSTVKIPDDVLRDSQDVYDTIKWSAKLDKIFRKNRQEDANLRWQYFGSVTGVHRVFPGHEWSSNFIGFHEDFDPRLRPWYITSTSSPKSIVIVLDSSASMEEHSSMDRMKAVTTRILSSLNKKDMVNIVVSRSTYWSPTGVRYPHKCEILSCNHNSLLPATTSNIREMLAAVQNLQPYGGSYHTEAFKKAFSLLMNTTEDECQNDIIFITDGKTVDQDHRCSPGYYKYDSSNNKYYQAGELCLYDFDELTHIVNELQRQRHRQIGLFTFLTTEEGRRAFKPDKQTCESMGSMATIRSSSDIYRQMEPYYSTVESDQLQRPPVWTTPYMDQAGLGLMATVSVPVFSNLTRRHLGVVGIDVQLKHIENIIRHELWGSAYAFVIDSDDGSAIIHPLTKPSNQLLENPTFIPITHLETHQGKPEGFDAVLKEMRAKKTGHIKVAEHAVRAKRVHDTLVWRPAVYSHYFYTDIPGSDFSFAFNLGPSDETYQHARDPPIDGPVSYLHEMTYYKQLQEDIPGAWSDLRPASTHIKYPDLEVSSFHSVVKLAPRCFCNSAAYMEEHRPSFIDIHEYINTFTPTYDVHCPRGTYRTDVRPDVKLTAQLDQLWKARDPALLQQIAWTYIGTTGGVFRIYPGVEIRRDFDPTMRPWYHRSEVNRGKLVVSGVFLDSVPNMGKMITMSRAIHKAKPLTPPDCTGERRGYGCPCTSNYQCKSGYCYFRSCADDLIQGVVAMDIFYTDFYNRVTQLLRSSGTRKYCNLRYKCNGQKPCEVRCYLVDDRANLVYDEAFIHLSDSQTSQYEEQSLATREGFLFSRLVKQGLYIRRTSIDHQGVCKLSKAIPKDHSTDRQWLPQATDNADDPRVARGPIPAFQNEYNCLQQVVYYEMNSTQFLEKRLIRGTLDDSPCSRGKFYFLPLKSTNLFLVVIDDYQDLSSPFNFNCHVSNRIKAPGTYHIQPNFCDETYSNFSKGLEGTRRQCSPVKAIPFYCGYSKAFHSKYNTPAIISSLMIIIIWFRPF